MRSHLTSLLLAASPLFALGQNVGINANGAAPHASALLDLNASAMAIKGGLLIPRMTTVERNAIAGPATSLLVFNTTAQQFEYFDGTVWRALISTATGWGLTGNAGTNPATNFLGTTDNQALAFRVNSVERLQLTTDARMLFNTQGTNPPSSLLGNPVVDIASEGTDNNIVIRTHTTPGNDIIMNFCKSGGSTLAPTNTPANDDIARLSFSGFQSGIFQPAASIGAHLDGTPTATSMPGRIDFNTTPTGSTTPVLRITIRESGNVGVGTVNPLDRLHVAGSIRMVDGNQALNKVMVSDANGTASWQTLGAATTNAWGVLGNAGTNPATNFIGTTDNTGNSLRTNNAERVAISNTGRFLVNTQGTTPAVSAFQTLTDVATSGGGSHFISMFRTYNNNPTFGAASIVLAKGRGTLAAPANVVVGDELGSLEFAGNSGGVFFPCAAVRGLADNTVSAGGSGGRLALCTSLGPLGTPVENMTIRSTGDVGIGTTAPSAALHVFRGSSGALANANAKLVLEDNADTYAHFLTPTANESGMLFGNAAGPIRAGFIFNSAVTDGLDFRTGGNNARMVIDQNGLVGIGLTAPATILDVDGGLTVRRPTSIVLSIGNNAIAVGDRSYLRFSSTTLNTATSITLGNGLAIGQLLIIECGATGTNGFTINDNDNTSLPANRVFTDNDIHTLIWSGADWLEMSFSAN